MKTKHLPLEPATNQFSETNARINEWVNKFTNDLLRWAFYKTHNMPVAEDLVQETFAAAYRSISGFKNDSHPKTWLFSILHNKIVDYHRKKFKNIVHTQSELQQDGASNNILESMFDENGRWRKNARPSEWDSETGQLLDNKEFRNTLQFCLEELPEKWFSAIHLKYLEEKNGQEICKDLNITPSNFWQLLRRARLQLRACIELKWFKAV